MKKKLALIIESVAEGELWGRVLIKKHLMVDTANSIPTLKKKMAKLVQQYHKLKSDSFDFEIQYDITGLFEEKNFLNASIVADRAGISRLMLRQYKAGNKFPTKEKLDKLEQAIHELGRELQAVKLAPTLRETV